MKRIIISLFAAATISTASAQEVALSTNLATLPFATLNLGAEFTLAPQWTLATDLSLPIANIWGDYNYSAMKTGVAPARTNEPYYANGWMATTELRYWFCEAFNKHHLGFYAGGARLGNMEVDSKLFGTILSGPNTGKIENARVGFFGISYGYYIKFFHGWGLDLYLGVGGIYAKYMTELGADYTDLFSFSLTRAGVGLSYKF